MARAVQKLTNIGIKNQAKPGIYGDGRNLYLRVSPALTKSWVFVYFTDKKRRELGLGAWPQVSLANARDLAQRAHDQLAKGLDPIVEKRRGRAPTLLALNESFCAEFGRTVTPKVALRWKRLVELHGGDLIKPGLTVDKITTLDIAALLKRVQAIAPTSAKDLRAHLKRLMDAAKVQGFRPPGSDNPAEWVGSLAHVLAPLGNAKAKHHEAMPYSDVPKFVAQMRASNRTSHQALAFLILTATRTRESAEMRYGEVDFANAVWTVPASRMKGPIHKKTEHRVPLSSPALAIIRQQMQIAGYGDTPAPDALVFPGRLKDEAGNQKTLSHGVFNALMTDLNMEYVPHGFRSSFNHYCTAETEFPSDLVQRCLAHTVANQVQRAYDRSDYLERRRAIMNQWAAYVTVPQGPASAP